MMNGLMFNEVYEHKINKKKYRLMNIFEKHLSNGKLDYIIEYSDIDKPDSIKVMIKNDFIKTFTKVKKN